MVNKVKLIDKIQDLVYTNENDKIIADKLISNYIKLINYTNFDNYRVKIRLPISLEVRHKAYSKIVKINFINNQLCINELPIELNEINKILPTYFES